MIKASNAHIWGEKDGCSAHPKLAKLFPKPNASLYTESGIISHEIAEMLLLNPDFSYNDKDSDEYINAKIYADHVLSHGYENIYIEDDVECSAIHPTLNGVIDCWAFENDLIHIFDYKYGYTPVEAVGNKQALCYLSSFIDFPEVTDFTSVIFTIVQPRGYHKDGPIRNWQTSFGEIKNYFPELIRLAKIATSDSPPTQTGAHCGKCSARSICKAAQQASFNAIDLLSDCIPQTLNPAAAANELINHYRALRAIEARITGLDQIIQGWLENGVNVPNFELKPVFGREKWAMEPSRVAELGLEQGVNLKKPLEVITPAQARKAGVKINKEHTIKEQIKNKIIYREKKND